jgi:hypothetical protein
MKGFNWLQSWKIRSTPAQSSTAFSRKAGCITKRSKISEPFSICFGDRYTTFAAGSQTIMACAPARACARNER